MTSLSTRLSKDEYFLLIIKLAALRSTCARRQVAAIIVSEDSHILSTGYNGVPRGFPHCTIEPCEGTMDKSGNTERCLAVHAEINALLQCMRLDLANTLYTSCSPCFACAKAIANTPITRVVCTEEYSDKRGKNILTQAGIKLIQKIKN